MFCLVQTGLRYCIISTCPTFLSKRRLEADFQTDHIVVHVFRCIDILYI
jgi:hypothetical protein